CAGLLAMIGAQADLVDHGRAEHVGIGDGRVDLVTRLEHRGAVEQSPLHRDVRTEGAVAAVRETPEYAVLLAEVVVQLYVVARAVGPVDAFGAEVRLRTCGGDDSSATQVVRGVPGAIAEEFGCDGVKSALRNDVACERRPQPVAAGVLHRGNRIVGGIAFAAE